MGASTIFYWCSVAVSLYVLWLLAFWTYEKKYLERTRLTFPRIVYMLLLVLCFAPLANIVLVILFISFALVSRGSDDFYVDSWLFEKPGERDVEDEAGKQ